MTQRLLWASTGTKNKNYSDVLYVEELIGPETVTTIPPATFEAFRDHGRPESRLTLGVDEAKLTILALEQAGVSMKEITDRLLEEGLKAFTDAFNHLTDLTLAVMGIGAYEPWQHAHATPEQVWEMFRATRAAHLPAEQMEQDDELPSSLQEPQGHFDATHC